MDERVVALKATDAQESAVALFQQEDRVALPVTDSNGTLIGIVTVDDVLDVAQTAATRTLQRFGGLEALDEPYLEMPFRSMVRRRASWLVRPLPRRDADRHGHGASSRRRSSGRSSSRSSSR